MTAKRTPKWKRSGYKSDEEYRAACSANRKTRRAAMAATKAKYTTARILEKMWDRADFDKPLVKVTKEQLMADCGCSLWSAKNALKELRDEGSVKPLRDWQGGRGVATTWRLCVAGGDTTPSDDQIKLMEAERERQAAWSYLAGKFGPMKAMEILGFSPDELKGVENDTKRGEIFEQKGGRYYTPPPQVPQEPLSQTYGQAEKDAALDAQRVEPSGPQTPEEWRQFGPLADKYGFDEALSIWNAQRKPQGPNA